MKDISITTHTKKPLVYVASRFAPCERHSDPIFTASPYGRIRLNADHPHVLRAQEIVTALSHEGFAPYASCLYLPSSYASDDGDMRLMGMTVGLSFLRHCAFMFVDKSDGISSGMAREILFAMKLRKQIREIYWPVEVESIKCETVTTKMKSRWPHALRETKIPHQHDCGSRYRYWNTLGLSGAIGPAPGSQPAGGLAKLFAKSR